jgi:hypothetical protein
MLMFQKSVVRSFSACGFNLSDPHPSAEINLQNDTLVKENIALASHGSAVS